jgi:hypothetical protein
VPHPFGHIACWVDGTAAGAEALAASLELWRDGEGRLSLLHATGPGEARDAERLRADWLRGRGREMPGADAVFLAGAAGVWDWARREAPDVIVVGAGAGRPPGLSAGGLVDELLERAPCAVLVVDPSRPRP